VPSDAAAIIGGVAAAAPTPGQESLSRFVLRVVLIVLTVVGVLLLLWLLRKPISWIILATFLAVALSGPVNRLSRWLPRGLAIAVTYLLLFLVPLGVIASVVPSLASGVNDLANEAPRYVSDLQDTVNKNPRLRKLNNQYGITDELEKQAAKLPEKAGTAAGILTDVGVGIVNSIFAGVTILILSVFMVANGRRWAELFLQAQPEDRRARLARAMDRSANAVGAYVGGALLQATIAGIATFIVLKILGVPFAGALAVLTGIADLIPLVGATIGAILVGIVTAFHDFPTVTIIWTVWAIAYQQIENSVIQPRIQSRAVDVQPFIVLVSVLFGSTLFGIPGALLAIPIAATIQICTREYLQYRRDIRAPPPTTTSTATG
jgi:predicted PurR-regulated permease PerM